MRRVIAGLLVVMVSGLVSAGVVPGQWNKVALVEPGKGVIVYLKSGDRVDGSFGSVGDQDLIIFEGSEERHFPKVEVEKILTASKDDSKVDGTMAGIAVGALSGVLLGAFISGQDDMDGNTAGAILGAAALGAGIGAGVGFAADSAKRAPTVLYKAQ